MRIGHGFDVHAFGREAPNQAIILGGVSIAHTKPLLAHSDGDVLLHALCDALLGAMGLGDIGRHFPDSDDAFKNIDSRALLRNIKQLMITNKFQLVNADMTIIAQAPKMVGYTDAMVSNISADLVCEKSQINIKATTTEKLGFTGRGEGIACEAVVLVGSLV